MSCDSMDEEMYDFWQSLSRSAFGDMVNDRHRNHLYFKAIQKTVNRLKTCKEDILGLDIGAGTGLLSLMSVKSGVHRVVACDCFEPIAKCAQNIVNINGFSDVIKVVNKRSDKLTVGSVDCDLERKADLLVAELFDTELIGEGAIGCYRHAAQHLLTSDALLVPSRAKIYCQLVESDSLFSYHQFTDNIELNQHFIIKCPQHVKSCDGSNVLHDIQMNQLKPNEDFIVVSEPEVVFEFEFNDISTLGSKDRKTIEFKTIREVKGPLVLFMWWTTDMDFEGEIVLSCAPFWTYNDSAITAKTIPWRDHWIQAIYYLSANNKRFELKANQTLKVEANRDEYSLWFNESNDDKCCSDSLGFQCKCGLHLFLSRTRIAMVSDTSRLRLYNKAIEEITTTLTADQTDALFIGDSSLLPIIAAKYKNIRQVFCLAKNRQTKDFIVSFAKSNECEDKITIIEHFDQIEEQSVGLVLSEPYFNASDLPWNHLRLWSLLNEIPPNVLTNDVILMPNKAVIKAIPIEFDDLWKINADVGCDVEGFDLSAYDQLIRSAKAMSDPSIESHPLWEYAGKAMADKPLELFCCHLSETIDTKNVLKSCVKFDISSHLPKLKTNYISIAFWVEFYLFDHLIENSGPIEDIVDGQYVVWNRFYRQGVCFLPNIQTLDKQKLLTFSTTFDVKKEEIECYFDNEMK